MGLRLRLNLLLGAVFFLALCIAVGYLLINARRAVIEELHASTEMASILVGAFNQADTIAEPASLDRALAQLKAHTRLRHVRIAAESAAYDGNPFAGTPAQAAGVPAWFYTMVEPDPQVLTKSLASTERELVLIADPAAEIAEAWREVRGTLLLLLVAFVAVVGVVVVMLGRVLRPLAELSSALEGVEQGHYATRLPAGSFADINQLTDRFNQMSSALELSEQNNAALAERSLAIQEEERRYLATELHDEMGQSITAIKALAASIRERADPVLAERATTIMDVSTSVYTRVRQMMTRLHPVVLDELGLVPALEQMVDDWNSHHGACFCRLELSQRQLHLHERGRIGIYRIAQEALTNIARHAAASEVVVELELQQVRDDPERDTLQLRVSDNGQGFKSSASVAGLGLRGIRERVRAMRGELHIDSAPGRGTCLVVRVPMSAVVDNADRQTDLNRALEYE